MKARVTVTLKDLGPDPQGKAIQGAWRSAWASSKGSPACVKANAPIPQPAGQAAPARRRLLESACEKLLANTVIEDYRVEVTD